MNLWEILITLKGKKSDERRRLLVEWNVDDSLWEYIQRCFDQEGCPINAMGQRMEAKVNVF